MPSDPLGKSISAFDPSDTLDGTETVALVQNTRTKRSLLSAIANYVIQVAESFTQSGSGAIAQDLQTRGRRTVFVTDYIPTNLIAGIEAGTNTTALQTYIEAAIAALGSNGGEVVFPPGTYYVSASVDVDDPGVVLRGMAGSGWSVGSAVRITTDQAIVVLNLTSGGGTRGAHVKGISILDTAGSATGAVKVDGQWNCLFEDVAVNAFSTGYAFSLDGSSNAIALTRFEGCQGRNNKYGIRKSGTVTATYVSPNTYFALSSSIADSIGIEMMEGKMFGAIDSYETGLKIVGDDATVIGRFEGNTTHVHIAGTTSRRNKVMGSTITGGTNGVQIDAGANIFDNVVALNTYSTVTNSIVDNSSGNNYIYEPQADTVLIKRTVAGTFRQEIRNIRNVATGDNAELLISAANGAIDAVLRAATAATNVVQVGSATNQNVEILRNNTAVITLNTNSGTVIANALVNKRVGATYGESVAIAANQGNEFVITASNGDAFTIADPTNGVAGQRITIRVRNTSGGALGTITWGSAYKLAAFTSPATGFSRSTDFQYNGTNWIECRPDADVPN